MKYLLSDKLKNSISCREIDRRVRSSPTLPLDSDTFERCQFKQLNSLNGQLTSTPFNFLLKMFCECTSDGAPDISICWHLHS